MIESILIEAIDRASKEELIGGLRVKEGIKCGYVCFCAYYFGIYLWLLFLWLVYIRHLTAHNILGVHARTSHWVNRVDCGSTGTWIRIKRK